MPTPIHVAASLLSRCLAAALVTTAILGCGDGGANPSASSTGTSSSTSGGGGSGGSGAGAPVVPGIDWVELSLPIDLTPDGSVALIEDGSKLEGNLYFFDTASKALDKKTSLGDVTRNLATGISANHRVSAYQGEPVQAGLWSEAGGWTHVQSSFPNGCNQDLGASWDVSADGSVVVGMLWNGCSPVAFRWTDTGDKLTELQVLGTSPPGSPGAPTNRATKVSDDGTVAAGFAQNGNLDRSPAIWKADGSGLLLDPNNQDAPGEVLSISADGKTAAGTSGYSGFAWTEAGGLVDLGLLPNALPSDPIFPNAIAAGGALIFGGVGSAFFTIPTAFVWTAEGGMRALQEIAAANGVEIPAELVLTNVLSASSDGTVVLGTALDDASSAKTFVLHLPVSAYGIAAP